MRAFDLSFETVTRIPRRQNRKVMRKRKMGRKKKTHLLLLRKANQKEEVREEEK